MSSSALFMFTDSSASCSLLLNSVTFLYFLSVENLFVHPSYFSIFMTSANLNFISYIIDLHLIKAIFLKFYLVLLFGTYSSVSLFSLSLCGGLGALE